MASLTKKDVLHIAALANLKLSQKEVEKFAPQLAKVVEYVGQLNEVETSGIEATSQTTGLENVLRLDKGDSSKSLSVEEATAQTEKIQNNYFTVRSILKK